MARCVGRAQGRNSKTCFMLLRVNLNHHPGDEKAYVFKYCVSICCRTIYMYICCRTICSHTHRHIYMKKHIYTCKKHKDFSGDIISLVLACLALVLLSFAFPATNQNEIGSKKTCLSNSRSVEAFINPVS